MVEYGGIDFSADTGTFFARSVAMRQNLPLINLIAFLITVSVNVLSNTGFIHGETVGAVSARYPSLITPAPYTFGIWIVIYFMLGMFCVSHLVRTPQRHLEVMQVGWWFVLSCVANCAWIFSWLYGLTGLSVLLMLGLLFCLIRIVIRTGMEMTDALPGTIVMLWWPFCFYLGWIVMATPVNMEAWLVAFGLPGEGVGGAARAMCLIAAAGIVYLVLTWRRNMREAAMVGVWALAGVGVADWGRARGVAVEAWVLATVLSCSSMLHAYRNRNYAPFRKR